MKQLWNRWLRTAVLWGLAGLVLGTVLSLPVPRKYVHQGATKSADYDNKGGVQVAVARAAFDWVGRNRDGFDVIFACLVAYFTYILASKTAGLFVETAGLRVVAEQQKIDFERSIKAAEEAAKASMESTNLARSEFLASHRPELVIHFVKLLGTDMDERFGGRSISVEFRIINSGTSACAITGSAVYLDFRDTFRPPPTLNKNAVITRNWFDVGNTDRFVVYPEDAISRIEVETWTTGHTLYLTGWIVYEDALNQVRTTYFCREYKEGAPLHCG